MGNEGSLNAWYYPLTSPPPTPPSSPPARDIEAGPSRIPSPKSRNGTREGTPSALPQGDNQGEDVEMGDAANTTGDTEIDPNSSGLGLTLDTAVTRSSATVPPPTLSRPSSPSSRKRNDPLGQSTTTLNSSTSSAPARKTPQQLKRIKHSIVHSASLLALGLDPTGRYLAVGGQDALLSLFSTKEWICTRTYDVST